MACTHPYGCTFGPATPYPALKPHTWPQIVYAVAIKLDSLAWEPDANAAVVSLACECMASDPAQRPTFAQLAKRVGDLLHRPAAQLKPARSR